MMHRKIEFLRLLWKTRDDRKTGVHRGWMQLQFTLAALVCSLSLFQLACTKSSKPDGTKSGASSEVDLAAAKIDMERYVVEMREDDYALGSANAFATIVVYSNFACDPCKRTWQVMHNLLQDYGEKVRVVHRSVNIPGYAGNDDAIEAAYAAGAQGKFWEMHRALFQHPEDFSRPALRAQAERIGLDVPRFLDDLDTGTFTSRRLQEQRAQVKLGVSAGPTSFINGIPIIGFRAEEIWHALVDKEILRAKSLIQEGVTRPQLYTKFLEGASRKPLGTASAERKLRDDRKAKEKKNVVLRTPDQNQRYRVLPGDAPGTGPKDAPVVVVEFADFQCPYCRKANEGVYREIREKYPKDLRWVVRQLPLEIHRAARGAARASLAAQRQNKYWPFHEALYAETGGLSHERFLDIARKLQLDVDQFKKDLEDSALAKVVDRDLELSHVLGIQGTPALFINGRYLEGVLSLSTYTSIVDEELAAAKKKMAQGVPRNQVFSALMESAVPEEKFPNAAP